MLTLSYDSESMPHGPVLIFHWVACPQDLVDFPRRSRGKHVKLYGDEI